LSVHLLDANCQKRDNLVARPCDKHIVFESPEDVTTAPERRAHLRVPVDSGTSINLGEGHSGTVLNVSEAGLAVRVAVMLTEHSQIPLILFRLPISESWVEINGQIAWVSKSRKEVGIKFIDLQEETRNKIRDWISLKSSQLTFQKESNADRQADQLLSPVSACRIREIRLDQDLRAFSEGWRECNSRFHDRTIHCDPDWIEERFKQQRENVRIYFLESKRQIIGAAPFVLSKEPLLCELGMSTVMKFPLRILGLQGYTPNMPAETSVHDMLFGQILESEFDAIRLDHVKTASFLWSYLHSSSLIRKFFSFYTPEGPLPHQVIHLRGSFASYMNEFSQKARKNRRREMKRLRERGDMQLIRVTKASEIDAFLEAACGVSQKTWQFVRYRWGIGARDIDVVRGEMQYLAQRGWLRSYLLKCGTVSCSFIIGQQYGSTFYTSAAGVHSAWRSYSAGTALLLLVLEDLFRENSPQFYDLDSYARYKGHFANESYLEANVWLFRRRAYPLLASSIYRTCNATTKNAGAVLDRLHLKPRVRQLLWG
jgi:Acetyltransferase (GNAT) domain/PilZ domain